MNSSSIRKRSAVCNLRSDPRCTKQPDRGAPARRVPPKQHLRGVVPVKQRSSCSVVDIDFFLSPG